MLRVIAVILIVFTIALLALNHIGGWLTGKGPAPGVDVGTIKMVPGIVYFLLLDYLRRHHKTSSAPMNENSRQAPSDQK